LIVELAKGEVIAFAGPSGYFRIDSGRGVRKSWVHGMVLVAIDPVVQ
jgi:hypothetical protein